MKVVNAVHFYTNFFFFFFTRVSQNVLQYFGNKRHNLAALDDLGEVVMVMNHTGPCDALLTGIHGFKLT